MALTTLDSLKSRLKSLMSQGEDERSTVAHHIELEKAGEATQPHLHDSLHWFQTSSPFFISPKHDGVRMITFPPQLSGSRSQSCKINHVKACNSRTKSAETPHSATTTCFSRYGRPIYGMFWIEYELALLRALCQDPFLVLDGELYIHQNVSDVEKESQTEESPSQTGSNPPKRGSHKTLKKEKDGVSEIQKCELTDAESTPSLPTLRNDSFKTGFLAVSALVHRLRGSNRNGPFCGGIDPTQSIPDRLNEVLQYVNTLPRYCLFDVVSFSPRRALGRAHSGWKSPQNFVAGRKKKSVSDRQISSELRRILQLTLEAHGVADPEMLRCVPNLTPFSQRVRTLYFLTDLLSRGLGSPTLWEAFGLVSRIAEGGAASGSCMKARKKKERKSHTGNDDPHAAGRGSYIQMIPYRLARSLDEAEHSLLPHYVAQGYEGAVIRTPTNLYEFREKRKDVLKRFIEPLLSQRSTKRRESQPRKRASSADANSPPLRWAASIHQDIVNTQPMVLLRTYASDEVCKGRRRATSHTYGSRKKAHEDKSGNESAATNTREDDMADSPQQIAQRALEHSKNFPRRCETCVKLLPFRDKEYAVLRPLLKVPSTNLRTRPLVAIPIKEVESLKGCEEIPIRKNTCRKQKATSKDESTHSPSRSDDGMVVFYGLQCLAENGRVFNVSIPKMSTEKQRALLHHLLEASRKRKGKKTLTGMYVTVKFASLTEHGVPRFGTVKAIRGGKGWFL